nr:MAG TPA: hypothetical protein [Caudoviricetes sp.]
MKNFLHRLILLVTLDFIKQVSASLKIKKLSCVDKVYIKIIVC